MPSDFAQWCWFIFFMIGTLGGWVFIGVLIWILRGSQKED